MRCTAWIGLLLAASCAPAPPPVSSQIASRCRIGSVAFDTLRLDGDYIHLDPQAFVSDSAGRILFAGRANYWFGGPQGAGWPEVFGVHISSGRVSRIPHPLPGRRLDAIRGVGTAAGWDLVFAEMYDTALHARADSARALWRGHFDGRRWRNVERLPTPPGIARVMFASTLHPSGRRMAWVVPYVARKPDGDRLGFVIHTRDDAGEWTGEFVPILAGVAEPRFTADDLQLAVQGADTTMLPDGNSLILRSRNAGWGVIDVLRRGREEPVFAVNSFQGPEVGALSWRTASARGFAVRAMVWTGNRDRGRVLTVDEEDSGYTPLSPVDVRDAGMVWATGSGPPPSGGDLELLILRPDGTEVRLTVGPSPFPYGFRSSSTGREVVVAGGVAIGRTAVALLLGRIEVSCDELM